MAESFTEAFERIIQLCQTYLEDVAIIRRDMYEDYAVLRLEGRYKQFFVRLRDIIRQDGSRKYSYYIFDGEHVVTGFDNAADPRALRLKYGSAYTQHRLETIPHHHTRDKQQLELTDEMDCQAFLNWLEQHL